MTYQHEDVAKQLGIRYEDVASDAMYYCLATGVAITLSALVCFFLWRSDYSQQICCDALAYWEIGKIYRESGILVWHVFVDLRLYAFPAFVAAVQAISDAIGTQGRPTLAVLQFGGYVGSALMLSVAIPGSRLVKTLTLVLIVLNIYALPYLVVPMADGAALVLFQVWLAAMMFQWRLDVDCEGRPHLAWFALAAFLSGLIVEVRPAYVWLPVATLIVAIYIPRALRRRRLQQRLKRLLLCLLMGGIPLLPQIAINEHQFGVISALPFRDLQTLQIGWGKTYLK